jgi:uncharacterized protein (DUF3084 family)
LFAIFLSADLLHLILELQKFEDLFSSKYAEKLGGMKVLINDAEEEEKNIQEKWEEASKDIKESKKPAVESGEEGQQKEKLQTKLDKLTAQKNAIEQKKKALFCSANSLFFVSLN